MLESYAIDFAPQDPSAASATVFVTLDGAEVLISQITVRLATDERPFPQALAGLNMSALVAVIGALSSGRLPVGAAGADESPSIDSETPLGRNPSGAAVAGATPSLPGPSDPPKPSAPPAWRRPVRASGRSPRPKRDLPSDVARMYYRLGSAVKLAKHYGVAVPVARGWIKQLASGGTVPNPWPSREARRGKAD